LLRNPVVHNIIFYTDHEFIAVLVAVLVAVAVAVIISSPTSTAPSS
jgi:hypothetical protein